MPEEIWSWSHERRIPSDPREGRVVIDELLAQLAKADWPDHDVFGVHLALEEALVNAIKHGNRHDTEKSVRVRYQMSDTKLRIEIEDEGEGFDPSDVPDPTDDDNLDIPSGRGLMLMRSYMSSVNFNDVGNQVVMIKERS